VVHDKQHGEVEAFQISDLRDREADDFQNLTIFVLSKDTSLEDFSRKSDQHFCVKFLADRQTVQIDAEYYITSSNDGDSQSAICSSIVRPTVH